MTALQPGAATMTVLFTDLVGSTAIRSRVGDDHADALRREHDELLERVIGEHRGTVVKGMGDGIMAVFLAPSEAVASAVAINQAVSRRNRKAKEPLVLRMGMSVGEVRVEGDDVYGTPVVEAARLCAKAADDQILASLWVRALAGSRSSSSYREVGEIELKGLNEPLLTYEVEWWEAGDIAAVPMPDVVMLGHQLKFAGRNLERFALSDAWSRARAGRGPLVLITGEDGVGKTRLAVEFAKAQYDEGATVLYGRCEEGRGAPFHPFIEALRFHVGHLSDAQIPEHLGPLGAELVRLLPELAGRLTHPEGTEANRVDPDVATTRLFDAVAGWISATTKVEPLVLIIDDLHLATASTLRLIHHVMRSIEPMRMLLLATWRQVGEHPQQEMTLFVNELRRSARGVETIHLSGLDLRGVDSLVASELGTGLDQRAGELADRLANATGGNPFMVQEALLYLLETAQVSTQGGHWFYSVSPEQLAFPESAGELVLARLPALGDAPTTLLRFASVMGDEFDLPILRVVAGVDEPSSQVALDQAIAAGFAVEIPGAHFRLSFSHPIVRAALRDQLDETWQAKVHQRVAEEIERQAGPTNDRFLFDIAHHYLAGSRVAGPARAADFATAAGTLSRNLLAHDESVAWYGTALALFEASGQQNEHRLFDLLLALGEAERRAKLTTSREHLLRAIAIAKARNDGSGLARAALALCRPDGDDAPDGDRAAALRDAIELGTTSSTGTRALLQAFLAAEYRFEGIPERYGLAEGSLLLARQTGDRSLLAEVLGPAMLAFDSPTRFGQWAALAQEEYELGESLGEPAYRFRGALAMAKRALATGQRLQLDDWLAKAEEAANALRQSRAWCMLWLSKGARAMFAGDLAGAESYGARAVELRPGDPAITGRQRVLDLAVRRARGTLGEVAAELELAVQQTVGVERLLTARVLADAGRTDLAHGIYAGYAAAGYGVGDGVDSGVALSSLAYLAALLRDGPGAETIAAQLEPYTDTFFVGVVAQHVGAHYMAMLAATAGRAEDAHAWFERAVTQHEAAGAVLYAAESRLEWARLCHASGITDRARVLAEQARSGGSTHKAAGVEAEAGALLAVMDAPQRAYGEAASQWPVQPGASLGQHPPPPVPGSAH